MRSLACIILAALTLGVSNASGQGPSATAATVAVVVADVRRESLSDRVEALGTLKANESVAITSKVTETISAVYFDDGHRVRAGDPLVELNRVEEQALMEEARVRADEAERQFDRVKSLVAQRSASESLLDERRRDLDSSRALLTALESRLADRLIKAPFEGVLGLRNISQGALVAPGDLITTLDDDRLMKLDFALPSVYLTALEPGLGIEARSAAFEDRVFKGVVRGVDSRIDPVTRSVQVRAIIPNPEGTLKPGLLMRVALLLNPREGLLIPEAAILHSARDHFVMRLVDTGDSLKAERLQIQIGSRRPGWVEVVSALAPGERVITDGNDKVRPGQPIRILAIQDGPRDLRAMTEPKP